MTENRQTGRRCKELARRPKRGWENAPIAVPQGKPQSSGTKKKGETTSHTDLVMRSDTIFVRKCWPETPSLQGVRLVEEN